MIPHVVGPRTRFRRPRTVEHFLVLAYDRRHNYRILLKTWFRGCAGGNAFLVTSKISQSWSKFIHESPPEDASWLI